MECMPAYTTRNSIHPASERLVSAATATRPRIHARKWMQTGGTNQSALLANNTELTRTLVWRVKCIYWRTPPLPVVCFHNRIQHFWHVNRLCATIFCGGGFYSFAKSSPLSYWMTRECKERAYRFTRMSRKEKERTICSSTLWCLQVPSRSGFYSW